MEAEMKKNINEWAHWIIRSLVIVIGFFLIQTVNDFKGEIQNNTNSINLVKEQMSTFLYIQAEQKSAINNLENHIDENESDIIEIQDDIKVMKENITDFYQDYGYLFTEKARSKLN